MNVSENKRWVRRGAAALLMLLLGCSPAPNGNTATILVDGHGTIKIEFLRDKAPKTVENFIGLANDGFYDGTTFHRVIPGFMIQGGDPNSKNADPSDDGRGGPGRTIEDEFSDVTHVRGIVSMANKGHPHSAGSQFFIVTKDSNFLDDKYTAFARVTEGIEVADAISAVERDARDRPLENVTVTSVTILE
jgi:peptidyl-prolyl cis-trans isomerase B (cyclophilin B)